ncbi:hypothetical protein PoB_002450000 [Plakobranchus ocellatus]|uniref:Uncharacterized protein n=1 Tax=Plakobranchus ocellatus TaxID=259542 RepID=A0AAV3ZSA9_9GAST|nr:hypothetical protein PoB_002450000 [Plakobranchus ocellatus]
MVTETVDHDNDDDGSGGGDDRKHVDDEDDYEDDVDEEFTICIIVLYYNILIGKKIINRKMRTNINGRRQRKRKIRMRRRKSFTETNSQTNSLAGHTASGIQINVGSLWWQKVKILAPVSESATVHQTVP